MDATAIGIIGICVMLALFMTRMPVAYVMALTGAIGFSIMTSVKGGLNLLSRNIYESFSSYGLTTIPLFILMGQFAFNSGISRRLYDTAYKFFGNIRGGLAMATVAACTAFGAVCGSSPATAATMATVGIPEMKRYNYHPVLATGVVASGGGIGMIMPPSVVMIVYGILTEQSIGALFVSGIIPALLIAILYIIAIYIWGLINREIGPAGEKHTWAEKFKSLVGIIDTLIVFFIAIGGMFFGIFTPTEAAAVGAFSVLMAGIIRRQINWAGFVKSLHETIRTSCMVLLLIAGAVIFGKFLAVTRIPFQIAEWVGALKVRPIVIMTAIVFVYFVGGCIMDALALIMLTIPIFFPVVTKLGYDPILFGMVIVLVTQMGVITPPVGINVFVVFGVARTFIDGIRLETIFKGVFVFLIATIIGLALILIFPDIVLYLPNKMYR